MQTCVLIVVGIVIQVLRLHPSLSKVGMNIVIIYAMRTVQVHWS